MKPCIDDGQTTIKQKTDGSGDIIIGQFDIKTGASRGIIRKISSDGNFYSEMVMFSGVACGLSRIFSSDGSVTFLLLNQ
jgi:hypothetical protein